ncbi:MAG: nucleotidyl transferase AbiEii/AbiGii toxin family protein [Spirochaetales bacterium]|nr:nucleotidyl transferase AbiEii/AbiGii toxin family protein [Spirochaetales bacterium]
MIDVKKLDQQWFSLTSREIHGDPLLLEKVTKALLLVEKLAHLGLKFIFKGGSALMLLLEKTARFSIDVDILLPQKAVNMVLSPVFDGIVSSGIFTRYEPSPRKKTGVLKKEHFRFFYNSLVLAGGAEDNIILDIVYEDGLYNTIISLPVTLPFLPVSGKPVTVSVPDLENLLGDKLTAFAPNTAGIAYRRNNVSMSLEIIKQLYDIGILFKFVNKPEHVRDAFENFARKQIQYRGRQFSVDDIYEDIFQTALCFSTKGEFGIGNYGELQDGIKRVKSYIFSENFSIPKGVTNASIAAYLAMILRRKTGKIEKYGEPGSVTSLEISEKEFKMLNKLKKGNPEAFYYWYRAIEARSSR